MLFGLTMLNSLGKINLLPNLMILIKFNITYNLIIKLKKVNQDKRFINS